MKANMKLNRLSKAVKFVVAGAAFGALGACGGSGGGSEPSVSGTQAGVSSGPVTGFGSVYVNGVRFDTDSASLRSDDGIEREEQMEKGMILTVRGEWDDDDGEGRASRVDYDDTLRGRLGSASWDEIERTGSLTVAGQTIAIDGRTVFKGATPAELRDQPADTWKVRISAWRLDDGSFRASFVGARPVGAGDFDESNEVEVEGAISDLDSQAQTFQINGLIVRYGSASFDDDLDRSGLANGLVVEVEGVMENGKLLAREIDDEDDADRFDNGDDVEISGPISESFDAATGRFSINGISIRVDDDTEFDDGLSQASDLVQGLLVSVEGEFRNGVLKAEEIEAGEGDAELEASVSDVNRTAQELTVGGVRVVVTNNTLLEDDDEEDGDRLRFDNLLVGDYLEIEGIQRSGDGGFLEALKIERDDEDEDDNGGEDDFELEGRITAIDGDRVTVMGLELMGASGYSGLTVGRKVEVEYYVDDGGSYVITELEVEDEDEDEDDD
ncbi:DUF5666 domain-containing protein [Marinobacter sp.]|uniref:DUF5666 domain-containing protein n=1 Tax=Marinobacter sp. TaxID=50741 RepID=UPI00384BCE73